MSSYEHVTLLLTWRVSSSPAHTDQLLFHHGRQLKFYWLMEFVSVQQNLNFNLTSWFKHGRLGESVRAQLQTVTTCQHEHLQAAINDHRYHAAAAERSPEPSKPRGGLQSDPACRAFSRPLSQRGTTTVTRITVCFCRTTDGSKLHVSLGPIWCSCGGGGAVTRSGSVFMFSLLCYITSCLCLRVECDSARLTASFWFTSL